MQALFDFFQLIVVIHLYPQMIQPRFAATLTDGEIDARVIQHPFRIIRLHHRRSRTEKMIVESDALVQIIDGNMDMHAFHECFSGRQQLCSPPQQFSVRKAIRAFMVLKSVE
jgi:hypothetical protein